MKSAYVQVPIASKPYTVMTSLSPQFELKPLIYGYLLMGEAGT
jgi:hypothetical protein